jgi:hypothetical protein
MSMSSCSRRQRRRRPQELNLCIERVIERLDQEPARRILSKRLLALGDRIVDDAQIVFDYRHGRRVELRPPLIEHRAKAGDLNRIRLLGRWLR